MQLLNKRSTELGSYTRIAQTSHYVLILLSFPPSLTYPCNVASFFFRNICSIQSCNNFSLPKIQIAANCYHFLHLSPFRFGTIKIIFHFIEHHSHFDEKEHSRISQNVLAEIIRTILLFVAVEHLLASSSICQFEKISSCYSSICLH